MFRSKMTGKMAAKSASFSKMTGKMAAKSASYRRSEGIIAARSASVMLESGNVEKVLVFKAFLKGSRGARGRQENEQRSEPERWEGVEGG